MKVTDDGFEDKVEKAMEVRGLTTYILFVTMPLSPTQNLPRHSTDPSCALPPSPSHLLCWFACTPTLCPALPWLSHRTF